LLGGKAKSVKMSLLQAGHLNDVPEKISDFYFSAKKTGYLTNWSNWRMSMFTIQQPIWRQKTHVPNSPPEVLEDIWEGMVSDTTTEKWGRRNNKTIMIQVVAHPNTPAEIAIRASASEDEDLQQAGFARLIDLEKDKKAK
jgi:hypothetical protein